ncbi:hypothetical protein IW261DRAFT_1576721 [Armillaria novae-zelandiae]|uniref:Uncharacterized protein n=1 Tax=Armillaria novae-zelandiae TaxID=153914 RepID=A0AA39TWG6_9AGAR|nr:hypothetical protein IW261DRAFT_1576721 [Armillaria novae-zelandiae]
MQASLPPDITNADIADILLVLGSEMNRVILAAHLQGMYSGILAVALWTIFTQKSRPISRAIVSVIIIYIMTLASFSLNWSTVCSAFVENGENIVTQITRFYSPQRAVTLSSGAMAAIATILVDCTMVYLIYPLVPLLQLTVVRDLALLVASIAFKIIVTRQEYAQNASGSFLFLVLYASLILATTLLCTLLMIYRILAVARATDGGGNGPRAYRHVIEVFIESSALYAISLIVYVAVFACGSKGAYYLDPIAGVTRGIAPTMLFGRVAAGHARPDGSWKGSVMTSPLRFGRDKTEMTSQEGSVVLGMSGFEDDLEAQPDNPEIKRSIGLREDTNQRGSQASEVRLGLAGDDPETSINKANH